MIWRRTFPLAIGPTFRQQLASVRAFLVWELTASNDDEVDAVLTALHNMPNLQPGFDGTVEIQWESDQFTLGALILHRRQRLVAVDIRRGMNRVIYEGATDRRLRNVVLHPGGDGAEVDLL